MQLTQVLCHCVNVRDFVHLAIKVYGMSLPTDRFLHCKEEVLLL